MKIKSKISFSTKPVTLSRLNKIIDDKPKDLSFSIYSNIITDSIWAK